MQFKVNSEAPDSLLAIQKKIREKFPNEELKFELDNANRVLHIHGISETRENAAQIESAIRETGFSGSWLTRGEENK